MNRKEIINTLIVKHGYQSCLKIGTQNGVKYLNIDNTFFND